MDHLPAVSRITELVDYIVEDEYDHKGFFGYPVRQGWNREKLLRSGDFEGKDVRKFESFLQSWLFFGLLAEVLGIEVDAADFTYSPDGRSRLITTAKLPKFLEEWAERETAAQTQDRNPRMVQVELVLDQARSLVSKYCSVKTADGASKWPINRFLSLSFMVLGETLAHAKAKILTATGSKIPGWHDDITRGWGNSKELLQRMKRAGWCPHSVHMVQGLMRGHVSGLYYASTFPRPVKHHDKCTTMECKAEQVSNDKYDRKHTEWCDRHTCLMLGPAPERLAAVIQNNKIPLLQYSDAEGPRVDVIPFQEPRKFVIFSHVWADGLGNPRENKLPKCQVKALAFLAHQLYDPKLEGIDLSYEPTKRLSDLTQTKFVPFWIDTLAIPVEEEQRKARKLAIGMMHRTYKSADKTIVLDAELMSQPAGFQYEEKAMRITMSGWMRRLWTLQEGVLSKTLYFKFDNKLVEVEELEESFPSDVRSLHSSVPEAARAYYHGLLKSEDLANKSHKKLLPLTWKAVQWRTTSHPRDETLAIATLLGIDPKPLLQVPEIPLNSANRLQGDEDALALRMQLLLSSLGDLGAIPPSMIFLPGPRLSLEGFRWAPRTWLVGREVDHPDPLSLPGPQAHLASPGLMVKYPGFKLHSMNEETWPVYWSSSMNDLAQNSRTITHDTYKFWFPSNKLLLEWYVVERDSDTEQNDLLDGSPSQEALKEVKFALIFPRHNRGTTPEISLLVAIYREENQILYVRILNRVWVSRETSQRLIQELHSDFKESRKHSFGEMLDSDQQWCIDGGGWKQALRDSTASPIPSNAQRIAFLENELQLEKDKVLGLQKEIQASRQSMVESDSKWREAESIKRDLMANNEAQRQEFDEERASLMTEIHNLKIQLDMLSKELEIEQARARRELMLSKEREMEQERARWELMLSKEREMEQARARVDELVKDSPMERFFEGKEDFIQEVAKNAVELENDTSTSLGSPDLLLKTIKVSLHQQVIYCDDSPSMRHENRWESQKNLVERIAKITTRVLPQGEGVALRFINQEVSNSSNLRLGDIENILKMKCDRSGNTNIGMSLRSKILKPLVYDKLDSVPKSLERPLLISILTDGAPEPEPEAMLKNAIAECRQKLNAAKYPHESVKFMIGQIGTSKLATRFLKIIRDNTEIADMVYCTSDQLDERFKKEHENEAKLDRWLIETLFEPLKDRKKKLEE